MQFIKTKCVLENKNHKAPGLILFLQIRKNRTPKKDKWGHDGTQKGRWGGTGY